MTIANGSFETQDAASGNSGEAADWSVSEVYTGEEFAAFTSAAAAPSTFTGQEFFESEWPAGFVAGLVAFAGYFDDIDPAFFDFSGSPDPTSFEDFENLWGVGSQGLYDFEASVPVFGDFSDPNDWEDFEEDWPAGASFLPDLATAGTEAASFSSSGPEDFENDWGGQPYNWAFQLAGFGGGEITPAGFYTGYLAQTIVETFEGEYFDVEGVTVDPATDTFTKTSHGLQDLWRVTFYNSGGRLPDGLAAETEYVVQNRTANTWQVAAINGGPIIDFLDHGFGALFAKHDTTFFWTEELEL